ncbi:hypothetical protein [Thermoanaerobacter mathranii]|uniref:hypothetical protein n=1 Tax=Thermoanaerobacter mathranii TaxID=583357 RepID=UPI003AAB9E34
MLNDKKINLSYLPYGDICKRSRSSVIFDVDYESFEQELLKAIEAEMEKVELGEHETEKEEIEKEEIL